MKNYCYHTMPGQTIVATCDKGYTFGELCDEIAKNGEGLIVAGEESDAAINALAGLAITDIDHVQRSDHGAGHKSVQIFGAESKLLRDINC
jgi:hypothetical protein